jgi:hypothetical protein
MRAAKQTEDLAGSPGGAPAAVPVLRVFLNGSTANPHAENGSRRVARALLCLLHIG